MTVPIHTQPQGTGPLGGRRVMFGLALAVLGAKVLLFVTFLMLLLKKHVMEETHLVLGDFVDRTVSTIVRQGRTPVI